MQNKKLMAVPMLLVLALVITGFAYAHWSETLYIDGTVDTGELDWGFVAWSCIDGGVDYHCRDGFAGPPPLFWLDPKGKNVGSCTLNPVDTDGDGDVDKLELTLTNVYPSYFCSISVYAKNTGTIPLIIDTVTIDGHVLRKTPTPTVGLDLTADGLDDVEIWWGNGFCAQLHPGDRSPEMSFWIHILQDAPEGATITFSIEIMAIQWNMYVPPTP